jgi:hypothetical protein
VVAHVQPIDFLVKFLVEAPCRGILILFFFAIISLGCQAESRAYMLNMYFALLNYANDHQGRFPQSGVSAYDALQKLYPDYCPSGKELSGLSGNVNFVAASLKAGKPLTDKITSWVYVQGLKDNDDPNLAILWDSQAGLFSDGKKDPSGGHAVLFLSGKIKQVPVSDWTNFLEQQKQLLKSLSLQQVGTTNKAQGN